MVSFAFALIVGPREQGPTLGVGDPRLFENENQCHFQKEAAFAGLIRAPATVEKTDFPLDFKYLDKD